MLSRSTLALGLVILATLGLSAPVTALNPEAAFSDYAIDRWGIDEGLPQISILSITQDREGYLWVGTQSGIARFDGTRFDVFDRHNSAGIDTTDAFHGFSDSRGRLWFGTERGALRFDNRRFSALKMEAGASAINGIVEMPDGELLFATVNGVMRYEDDALVPSQHHSESSHSLLLTSETLWIGGVGEIIRSTSSGTTRLALPPAAKNQPVRHLAMRRGSLWMATRTGLYRQVGDHIEEVLWDVVNGIRQDKPYSFAMVESLYTDRDGVLWIGTAGSLYRLLPNGALNQVGDTEFVINAWIASIFEDREGNLWLGSRSSGLTRLWNGWARVLGVRQGLSDPLIWAITLDPQGRVVFGSNSNVMRLEDDVLQELVSAEQLQKRSPYELNFDHSGRLWIGTRSGVALLDQGRLGTPSSLEPLNGTQINVVLPTDDGSVWLGTHRGLYRYADDTLHTVDPDTGSTASRVRAIHIQANGDILLGTEGGLRRVRDGQVDIPPWAKRLDGIFVSSFTDLGDGLIGLTTRDAGLGLLKDEHLRVLDTDEGLPLSNGWAMRMVQGQIYVSSIDGVWRIARNRLPDPRSTERVSLITEAVLGRFNGSQTVHCCNGGARSRVQELGDSLWFPAIQGAVELKTDSIMPPPEPPSAIVRGLKQGKRWFENGEPIVIDQGRRDVEIEFTGISFRDPKSLNFRYRLEGFDNEWVDAGVRRSAFYTNLPPGLYRFRVQARHGESITSIEDGVLDFELVPAWFERTGIRRLAVVLAVLTLIGLQFWLTRRYRRRGELLQALVDERTRELRQAMDDEQAANSALFDANETLRNEVQIRQTTESALKQRNEQLEALNSRFAEAQNQLLQSEKMASVGQLAAGVAHEINNPIAFVQSNLGALRNYLDIIFLQLNDYEALEWQKTFDAAPRAALAAVRERVDTGFVRKDVSELIHETAEGIVRVVKIVADLKDFSHVNQEEWQQADLHRGLDSTLNVAAHELKYRAEVIKEYGEIPLLDCMPFQINQVFMNLLVNAAQAMDQRGTITIRTGSDAEQIWVQIADTGKGIRPEHLNRVFEPFFTTKPVGKGTGLGLSVSYSIIKMHGGTIDVDSVPGKGTMFTVRLPVKRGVPLRGSAGTA
jgi:signal transduction histidine kinase/ligand-binding sensor domain-containing protein